MNEYPFSYRLGSAGESKHVYKESQLKGPYRWKEIRFPLPVYFAFLSERGLSLPEHWAEHLPKEEPFASAADDPLLLFWKENNCDADLVLPVLREWAARPEARRTAASLVHSLKLKNPDLTRKQVEAIERLCMPRGTGGAGNKKPFNLVAIYDEEINANGKK